MTYQTTPIDGGLDLVTAPQAVAPGRLIACSNYEIARQRGIRRMDGYEPFGGGPSPSYFTPTLLHFTGTLSGNHSLSFATVGETASITDTALNFQEGIYTLFVITSSNNVYLSVPNLTQFDFQGYVILSVQSVPNPSIILSGRPLPSLGFYGFGATENKVGGIGPVPLTVSVVSSTSVSADLSARSTFYSTIRSQIQQVPGQGNVNGLFWLKNQLYATRDYMAVTFTVGSIRPNPGDVIYQGASLGAATWSATVALVVTDSGTAWGASPGTATGTIMVYNAIAGTTLNALPTNSTSVKNFTQANVTAFTAGTAGTSTAAGLFLAVGGRGTTVATASWQWCDLGYNISYGSGGPADLPDMNFALVNQPASGSTTATQALNTQFRTAGTAVNGGWTNVGTPVTNLTDVYTKDGGFVYYSFTGQLGYGSYLTLTNFGFTDADVPVASAITGIEIQISYGGFWPLTTPSKLPLTFKSISLLGTSGTGQPDLGTPNTTFKDNASGSSNDPTLGGNYNFRLMDIGAPPTGNVPPSKLGYTGIAAADIKSSNFGIRLEISGAPPTFNQNVYAGIDYVKIRFAYLPAGNGIYFWNPNCVCYPSGGTPSSGLTDGITVATNTTVTSATGDFVVRGVSAGMVVVIPGAGVAAATYVGTVASVTDATHIVVTPAPSTSVNPATVKIFQVPVHAQIVKRYRVSGVLASNTAAGQLFIQFIQSSGTIGGPPPRLIASGEQIRSWPGGSVQPDGGVFDSSIQYALTTSTSAQNTMDWSALLTGVTQPDGVVAPPSKYQSVTNNFYASTGLEAIYGVSGGGPAFYYDGVKTDGNGNTVVGNFSRILTGLPLQFETPRSIVYHQGHVVLGYYHGVIQWSNAENVLSFDPTEYDETASDNGFGERVTALASINGDSLAVGTQSRIQMMQGNLNIPSGSATVPPLYESTLSPTSGIIEYTLQPMTNYTYADFRGITQLGATQKYGDFEIGHVSADVAPFLIPRLQLSSFFESVHTGIINSVLIRNKNLARYFFADGAALSMTYMADGENPQFSIQNYTTSGGGAFTMDVVEAFTETLGRDRIFCATADGTGNVFEMERSNGFNGAAIAATATLVPDTAQVAYQNKQFGQILVYGQAQDYAQFNVSRSPNYDPVTQGTGGNAITGTFGSLTAAPTGNVLPEIAILTSQLALEGTALNLRFDSSSNQQFPHVIQALSYNVSPLGAKGQ